MKNQHVARWISSILVAIGAASVAFSPTLAATAAFPFVCMLLGQLILIHGSIKMKDWPFVCLSVVFVGMDVYGILVRLT